MKAKWILSSILVGATLMSSLSWAGGHNRPPRAEIPRSEGGGSNTGNGGVGESYEMGVVPVTPMGPMEWCDAVSGWLDLALSWSDQARTFEGKRMVLEQSLQNILKSYDDGNLTFQPLTYSLIATTLQINDVFPRNGVSRRRVDDALLGNQVALLVIERMIDSIKTVNSEFDLRHFVPMYRGYRPGSCYRGHCPAPELPRRAYIDGISSIREVLTDLFAPALSDLPQRGSIIDAMADDLWELKALERVLAWMEVTFENDVFRRQFSCLRAQISGARQFLVNYLSGVTSGLFDSRQISGFIRDTLSDTLDYLDAYDAEAYSCRTPARSRHRYPQE